MKQLIVLALLVVFVSVTSASSTTQSVATTSPLMAVSAAVVSDCVIGTPDALEFEVASAAHNVGTHAQASVPVACSNGGPYKVSVDNGQNYAHATRNMTDGSNAVPYSLCLDSDRSSKRPTCSDTEMDTSASRHAVIYGTIPPQAAAPVASYSDQVQITVEY